VSLRGTVLLLSVLAILISEVRFSWVEVLVGRYLAVTNNHRPESGSVWEQGRVEAGGHPDLGADGDPQLTAQREAREADSLAELIDSLSDVQGAMISAAQFKTLYSRIPESLARTLFSPILILRISAEKHWDRVYMERDNNQVGIYLLDRGNNVLSHTTLTDQQLRSTGTEAPVLAGTLDEQTGVRGPHLSGGPVFHGPGHPSGRKLSGACSPNPAPCWPLTGHRFVWASAMRSTPI
jgi:hypothetical protein